MNNGKYLSTGEFAKMMNVTKNTLFHYDQMGLFSPELKLENDYRYYYIYQSEELDAILLLKELGMSLTEIKEYLKERTPERMQELLLVQEQQLEEKIKSLKSKKSWIREKRKKIEQLDQVDLHLIQIQHFKERYYIKSSIDTPSEVEYSYQIGELIRKYKEKKGKMAYEISYLQKREAIGTGECLNYMDVALLLSERPTGIEYQVLEEGNFVVAYHSGHWNTIGETYKKMQDYINTENIEVEETFFEISLLDKLMVQEIEEYVTEIFVRIK
ncbi:MAG: MerR family transcriptional regulator [bacterium]|nr:MerR family transcriptional regulator [bacterium]